VVKIETLCDQSAQPQTAVVSADVDQLRYAAVYISCSPRYLGAVRPHPKPHCRRCHGAWL